MAAYDIARLAPGPFRDALPYGSASALSTLQSLKVALHVRPAYEQARV